jgi:Tfp pilus assembly protein PilW
MKNSPNKEAGFTLMEALVATFLFAIVMSAVMGIYISVLQLNSRADSTRIATEFTRYFSETLTKEIRNGTFDYYDNVEKNGICNSFPSQSVPDYRLSILNVDNDHLCFFEGDVYGTPDVNGKYLWLAKNNFAPIRLNSDNVFVQKFKVYVQPLTNPYCKNPPSCSQAGSSQQPMVTVAAEIKSNVDPKSNVTIPFETTISLPVYDIAP